MARRHGRCMRGTRLVAKVPHDRWRALTSSPPCAAIGSTLLASSMDRSTAKASAPASSRCSSQRCNPAMSSSWTIPQPQAATDPPRHPHRRRQALLLAALLARPQSLEQVFAKLKTLLRKAAERTIEATWRRTGQLLDAFTPAECANYLKNAAMPQSKMNTRASAPMRTA
jgi:hypothetical protein